MARKRFHGLQKVKIRATWSKYNLYNLSRWKPASTSHRTFFQQKWEAKSTTRAYHGEQVREKQWQRMFTPKLNSVIPISPRYLADNDGSELAAGRGSGREESPDDESVKRRSIPVPYMQMTYAPLERRLDMAVWRALFASSARQARQMCVHGQVKVNGQKMPYPGYLLNPGDMFQVEPDRVLFATGESKNLQQARDGRHKRRVTRRMNTLKEERKLKFRAEKIALKATKEAAVSEEVKVVVKPNTPQIPKSEADHRKETRKQYNELLKQVKNFMETPKLKLGAKKKQAIRAYVKDVKSAMGSLNSKNKGDVEKMDIQFAALAARLSEVTEIQLIQKAKVEKAKAVEAKTEESVEVVEKELSEEERQALREAIVLLRENPVDETKPYATPWRPRPYMSAFAFIPRYLEVNQNVCSAVYLRHPVVRPGMAEVASPFGAEVQQLAFNWYLRRR